MVMYSEALDGGDCADSVLVIVEAEVGVVATDGAGVAGDPLAVSGILALNCRGEGLLVGGVANLTPPYVIGAPEELAEDGDMGDGDDDDDDDKLVAGLCCAGNN